MGEDRISKFVRTLEILGEGRRKVESGILQWKVESGKWKMVLNELGTRLTRSCLSEEGRGLPDEESSFLILFACKSCNRFLQWKVENGKWKIVLEQLGIFPSPMGEDRISKFVRTLEILGEGRRKVESGILQWKVESGKWKMVLNELGTRLASPCLSELCRREGD